MYGFRTEGKNNNIGKFMEMFHSIEAKMDALIKALNGNGNPVPNSPEDPVNGVSLKNPATAALLQTFTKALQDGGFLPKNPLHKRGVGNDTPAEPFSSISGPNLTLWKLHELKKKVKADDFVANLPNASAVAAMAGAQVGDYAPNNTWDANDYTTVKNEYQKLADVVNELKTLFDGLKIK